MELYRPILHYTNTTIFIMKHISILLLFFSALHLQAQQIDAKKSMVTFKIGNMGVMSVNGSIKGMHGDIKFNPKTYRPLLLTLA